jgi:hypothetical protein
VLKVIAELPAGFPVQGSLIWVRVFDEDNLHAAQTAAEQMVDPRLRHFYDPQQRAAREMAAALGGPGRYAWDTYLVFSAGLTWSEAPPEPSDWVHQLDHAAWAPAARRYKGQALENAIRRMMTTA